MMQKYWIRIHYLVYGSKDPDLYQNVTDPEHWFVEVSLYGFFSEHGWLGLGSPLAGHWRGPVLRKFVEVATTYLLNSTFILLIICLLKTQLRPHPLTLMKSY